MNMMTIYEKTLHYFRELSSIPRRSHEERNIRNWLIKWVKSHNWEYRVDQIGNLLVWAETVGENKKKLGNIHKHLDKSEEKLKIEDGRLKIWGLCLQSHLDMVGASEEEHNWKKEGVTIVEKDGILYGNNTTLGADNGIGVAAMMAIAEMEGRPPLELLFTVGEEVGCIGAVGIKMPLKSPYALNLDWCQSETIGIGCGGTLKIGCQYAARKVHHEGTILRVRASGFRGGHSGVDIGNNQGNAIIELARLMHYPDIEGIADIKGGEAYNAIPRSARAICAFEGDYFAFEAFLEAQSYALQSKYDNPEIVVTAKIIDDEEFDQFYEKDIVLLLARIGSGPVDVQSDGTVMSSWNIGKIRTKKNKFRWACFLRTNEDDGIQKMRRKILAQIARFPQNKRRKIQLRFDHKTPVWYQDPRTHFVRNIRKIISRGMPCPIEATSVHATIEVGLLAKKYPNTEWLSMGATCHDMHTPREHISLHDLEEFCVRLEKIIKKF